MCQEGVPASSGFACAAGTSDPWVGLPRRGAPRPGLLMRSSSSLSTLRSLRSAHTYGSLGSHNTATAMFAPGARH